ncbi:Serine/threonine-protein kinase VHS1-like protein [Elsinoe fawcettii]|nr:Serine/threonine-protein kinase VHS1-like protein [Elsinoe fawcettii]
MRDPSEWRNPDDYCNLPAAIVHSLFLAIPSALCHLVEHGLEHNDVKPDNIVATSSDIKLIDFGRSTKDYTGPHRLSGTASYVPVDILLDDSPSLYPGRRDTYAFIATFIFALRWKALPKTHPFNSAKVLEDPNQAAFLFRTVEETIEHCGRLESIDIYVKQAAAMRAENRMSPAELLAVARKTKVESIEQAVQMAPQIRAALALKALSSAD